MTTQHAKAAGVPEEQPNIIQRDGSLSICVPVEEVTWYDFLGHSRVHNSLHGGWNHKSLWSERGLQRLLATPSFIQTWTKNSLETDCEPDIRTSNFMLDRKMSQARLELAELEGDESENAINVRLFKQYSSLESNQRFAGQVRFFSYEVPLSSTKSGMLKIDLLGAIDERELAIVELKRKTGSDSPLMALTEAICYALQLIRCKKALIPALKQINMDWDGHSPIHLFVVAPEGYWKYWASDRATLNSLFNPIITEINGVLAAQNESTLLFESVTVPD